MTRVVGVGNEFRGDDAAGLLTVRRLRRLAPPGTILEESTGDPARLIEILTEEDDVVIVDACRGPRPGELALVPEQRLDLVAATSSHGLGVAEAVRIARALGSTAALRVWAVSGRSFGPGDRLSPEVRRAIGRLAARIALETGSGGGPVRPHRLAQGPGQGVAAPGA